MDERRESFIRLRQSVVSYHDKTKEEFLLHAITALVHNGAFSLCDGMNPDGTIASEVYTDVMKNVFDETRKYEQYVSGKMLSNVSIWVPTHSKFTWNNNGNRISELVGEDFLAGQVSMASIVRENNIPFDVIASRNLKNVEDNILVVSDVASIRDDEMDAIESYVRGGGNLYVSGHIGHPRLYELLEVKDRGMTEHSFTYMNPTEAGIEMFEGFNAKNPLSVDGKQHIVEINGPCSVLATISLPFTMEEGEQFAAIHSNPPGAATDMPAIILKSVGKGKIMWLSAPIEKSKPYMSKRVVHKLLESLYSQWEFKSNAPSCIEIVGWKKEHKRYFAAINQQEELPISPIYDVYIEIPGTIKEARLLEREEKISIEYDGKRSRIKLPKIDIFHIVEVE
ncbi:hypothetical protein Back11_54260 [Paenibacillus baekrokdamisoli]|uniref:Uncharacterized protein n=1 Tax=Paenibacillus baekrokdamisoli TaxID=1712516 RepID=A0A3G9JDW0_9BACL|nr:hypothetical protein [Paenibacillus baekrokdamisoli]MBB3071936.1 hypothetical protein [Paenibacillus baekrokdamisoli]BBH24081.1 hypothetical protein Back11_54260 [Paenibacillus baekrokdamisoli]